jgi:hypothetical protein
MILGPAGEKEREVPAYGESYDEISGTVINEGGEGEIACAWGITAGAGFRTAPCSNPREFIIFPV